MNREYFLGELPATPEITISEATNFKPVRVRAEIRNYDGRICGHDAMRDIELDKIIINSRNSIIDVCC